MQEAPGTVLEEVESAAPDLRLIVAHDPWLRLFLQNVGDLFKRQERLVLDGTTTTDFWPDVFVDRPLPWWRFAESGGLHVVALFVIFAATRFLALHPHITMQPTFSRADVVYYAPSEYLPPLDTRRKESARAQKADPELAEQPIISLPPEADNHSQTIVTPPNIRLSHDVPLPNTVSWSERPQLPIAPAPLVPAAQIARLTPQVDRSVIVPPPQLQDNLRPETMQSPQAAVIAPPPALDADSSRRVSDINIGHSTVIAPAPQLPLDEQRMAFSGPSAAIAGRSPQVIAPPPALAASGGSRRGNMIALSLHPAVGAPPDTVAGNRRGSFATTPGGHRGASGAPGSVSGASSGNGAGSVGKNNANLPTGLYVGKSSNPSSAVAGNRAPTNTNTVNPNLIANARPPRMSRSTPIDGDIKISEAERDVFGGRKIYSLSLNMPNLNSGSGSWIIRFAALNENGPRIESSNGAASNNGSSPDLSSPVATRKVDPAYPLELMRQNVGGTVVLYGIIRSDGTVGNVRVLHSVDSRLDRFAREAISKWQFQPATKNGTPVDVEATFLIPFRPVREKTDF
jgi:TonB family protein